jgi:DinB superfamily
MEKTAKELQDIVDVYAMKIASISDQDFSAKVRPEKWSKKEVLGHLIDSAQNNIRRFICGQYESVPPAITYQQDFWVKANGYQAAPKDDVILLWKLINARIVTVLAGMPEDQYHKQCNTGSLRTLSWLADDYVKHTKHHLNQIIPNSFNIQYP